MKQDHTHFAPEALADESASPLNQPGDALAFEPVPVRPRRGGISPEKQREYVEALADTGVAREAAARIGVTEQSINRLRRRADARSFDLACAAAARLSARCLRSIAYERAIEGSVKRHYYHGELKSEEVVYDNRLLIYLLGRTEHLLDEPAEVRAVAGNWEPFVEAMEQGLPPPDLRPEWQREQDERMAGYARELVEEEDEDEEDGAREEVWEEDWEGHWGWLTSFPPPAGFDGVEDGLPGEEDYRRSLTDAEEAALAANDAEEEAERAEEIRRACARRDRYFGFAGGLDEGVLPGAGAGAGEGPEQEEISSPREAEPLNLPPVAKRGERPGGGSAKRARSTSRNASEDRVEQSEDHQQGDHDDGEHDEADQT